MVCKRGWAKHSLLTPLARRKVQIKAKGVAPRSKVVPSNGVGRRWRGILEYSRKYTTFTGK